MKKKIKEQIINPKRKIIMKKKVKEQNIQLQDYGSFILMSKGEWVKILRWIEKAGTKVEIGKPERISR